MAVGFTVGVAVIVTLAAGVGTTVIIGAAVGVAVTYEYHGTRGGCGICGTPRCGVGGQQQQQQPLKANAAAMINTDKMSLILSDPINNVICLNI
jgi:hypothetical protein